MSKNDVKQNRISIVATVLCCSILILSVLLNYNTQLKLNKFDQLYEEQTTEQYVMYIGLNDKDVNQQIISTEEAKAIVKEIVLNYTTGYTLYEAEGVWEDDNGMQFEENSLVCLLATIDIEEVHRIKEELLKELNQASIMIEKSKTQIMFFDREE